MNASGVCSHQTRNPDHWNQTARRGSRATRAAAESSNTPVERQGTPRRRDAWCELTSTSGAVTVATIPRNTLPLSARIVDIARSPRTSLGFFASAVIAGSSGCENDYEIVPTYPTFENSICLAESVSSYTPVASQNRNAGTSVAIASTGDYGVCDEFRWVITGAPGRSTSTSNGKVRATLVDAATGYIVSGSGRNQLLTVSGAGAQPSYGQAVFAADIRDCYAVGAHGNACGTEVIAGAPDMFNPQAKGAIYWFEALGDYGNLSWAYKETINPPAALQGGAQFGYSITGLQAPADPDFPWLIGENPVPWIAVGAPGRDTVFIYRISSGSSSPFTATPQSLVVPTSFTGRRFGHSLVAGDFNDDGYADLAVGLPLGSGADNKGRVFVYRGRAGVSPLRTTPLELDGVSLDPSGVFTGFVDEFGASVAAGPFDAGTSSDALVVGAPAASGDFGGLCEFTLVSDSSAAGLGIGSSSCWLNDFSSAAAGDRLGESVAVGNFHNLDGSDRSETDEALLPEVAAGRPGTNGGSGTTVVFLTDSSGFREDDPLPEVIEYPAPSVDAAYGSALAGGYIQETFWEDLLVGAPARLVGTTQDGSASLTRAMPTSSCDEVDKFWQLEDVDGDLVTIKVSRNEVTGKMSVVWEDDFDFAAVDDFGLSTERECDRTFDGDTFPARFEIPAGSLLELDGLWGCGGVGDTQTWTDADLNSFVESVFGVDPLGFAIGDVTLELVSSTRLDLSISVDPTMVDIAMALNGVDDAVECEPVPLGGQLINPVAVTCE